MLGPFGIMEQKESYAIKTQPMLQNVFSLPSAVTLWHKNPYLWPGLDHWTSVMTEF